MRDHPPDDPIGGIRPRAGMSVESLVDAFGECGFSAATLAEAADITARMFADDGCTVVLSLAGALVPAGLRPAIADVIRHGHVDARVTTGASLTHDTIEAVGGRHHHGEAHPTDGSQREHDEALRDAGVDRIYNVYLPQEHFATLESHCWERVFPDLEGEPVSIAEVTRRLGEANREAHEGDEPGIAAAAAAAAVPVFCPAIQDSILGLQAWLYSRTHDFAIDALRDMTDLTDVGTAGDRAGALLVGGGVPKNFTLQSQLVTPGAYDYAVQITMDPEVTGGLSGASLDEARSWGKLEPDAENVTVHGDAMVALPLVLAAVYDRLAA
ncbi:MAG: deoxyhypusine synthase [Halobacteriales archaeon]